MNSDSQKPKMGRINLPVPMELKSLCVKAAHKSGTNLETWVTRVLDEKVRAPQTQFQQTATSMKPPEDGVRANNDTSEHEGEISLELQSQDHTEVYPTTGGYVGIRQVSRVGEESVILIRPDDIDRLAIMLKAARPMAEENLREYRLRSSPVTPQ